MQSPTALLDTLLMRFLRSSWVSRCSTSSYSAFSITLCSAGWVQPSDTQHPSWTGNA
ncbi:hypothetical protein [Pseudomonas sp. WAC2]|uniref:hypothetical protein n=1 Tax=Pseudomonas sp. WAC2 TaxID=3055057 RepID=UPI0025B0013B|nr:hypothetical protein [Pseudomonas sp. WAC2]MDN3233678.1 hypothetical protein [Pseudomonas sp. WAC2]